MPCFTAYEICSLYAGINKIDFFFALFVALSRNVILKCFSYFVIFVFGAFLRFLILLYNELLKSFMIFLII